jgi:hypothetical protein
MVIQLAQPAKVRYRRRKPEVEEVDEVAQRPSPDARGSS